MKLLKLIVSQIVIASMLFSSFSLAAPNHADEEFFDPDEEQFFDPDEETEEFFDPSEEKESAASNPDTNSWFTWGRIAAGAGIGGLIVAITLVAKPEYRKSMLNLQRFFNNRPTRAAPTTMVAAPAAAPDVVAQITQGGHFGRAATRLAVKTVASAVMNTLNTKEVGNLLSTTNTQTWTEKVGKSIEQDLTEAIVLQQQVQLYLDEVTTSALQAAAQKAAQQVARRTAVRELVYSMIDKAAEAAEKAKTQLQEPASETDLTTPPSTPTRGQLPEGGQTDSSPIWDSAKKAFRNLGRAAVGAAAGAAAEALLGELVN